MVCAINLTDTWEEIVMNFMGNMCSQIIEYVMIITCDTAQWLSSQISTHTGVITVCAELTSTGNMHNGIWRWTNHHIRVYDKKWNSNKQNLFCLKMQQTSHKYTEASLQCTHEYWWLWKPIHSHCLEAITNARGVQDSMDKMAVHISE